MFEAVDNGVSLAELEKCVLDFWEKEEIFAKSLDQRKGNEAYVFYDGPPFATGLPHYGHLLAGTIKDVVPRYQTMRGKYVERTFGWDCHGLPIEHAVEKVVGREKARANPSELRHRCRDYAREWVATQRDEFKQIGRASCRERVYHPV